jgi:hypothetical protein
MSSFYGSAKATQEADTVMILQSDGRRKFLEIKKNRFNGNLGHTPLHFDRRSCRYTEVPPIDVSSSKGKQQQQQSPPSGQVPETGLSNGPVVDPWTAMFS